MDARTALRTAQIIHIAFVAAIPLYAVVGEFAGPAEPRELGMLYTVFLVLAVSMLAPAAMVRQKMVRAAEEELRLRPDELPLLGRWLATGFLPSST